MKFINCSRVQFSILQRLANGENLPVATHSNATYRSMQRRGLISDGVGGTVWQKTDLGNKSLANKGKPIKLDF
jgi:hypothetical protein